MTRSSAERGYTLLPLLVLVGVAATSFVYVRAMPRDDAALRAQRTAAALALARDALIGRAAADNIRPGSLPCPDVNNDGTADGAFGNCTRYLGRLPWRTLGLPELRDGWGERLWYVLSSAYRDNASGGPLNSDTPGALTLRNASGTVLAADVPALVIAPGPVVGGQSREPGNQSLAAMYLEGENANGDAAYVAAPASAGFNDTLLAVGREDLFRLVIVRVAKEARDGLERYRAAHQYYPAANPYAAGGPMYYCDAATLRGRIPLTINSAGAGCAAQALWDAELPDWFFSNGWNLLTHYAVSSACADPSASAQASCTADGGPQPLDIAGVSPAVRVVVVVSGPARPGETRPCTSAAQCVDDAPNGDDDTHYVKPSPWPAGNDRLAASCATAAPCEALP